MPASTKKTIQSPINTIDIDPLTPPTPEQLQLLASDYITRVLAAMQQRQPRIALVRVTQLQALCQEFPQMHKAYPGLASFIRFGGHYCAGPRVKAAAIFFLCQKAAPILRSMTKAVSEYIAEQDQLPAVPESKRKLERLGNSLAVLQKIMPKIVDEARLLAEAQRERAATRSEAPVSETDLFVLEQAQKARTHDLATTESAVVRAAIVTADAYVSKVVQRQRALEYGIHKVMGSYYLMTSATLIGIARKSETGDTRAEAEVDEHMQQLLLHRNTVRARTSQPALAPIGNTVIAASHKYWLLFDADVVASAQVHVKRWSFMRMPGTAEIEVELVSES